MGYKRNIYLKTQTYCFILKLKPIYTASSINLYAYARFLQCTNIESHIYIHTFIYIYTFSKTLNIHSNYQYLKYSLYLENETHF